MGCYSCLRGVLRQVDASRSSRIAYPFSYWEHRSESRSISVQGVSFDWAYEPHDGSYPVGRIIEWFGGHDFLIMKGFSKYVTMRINCEPAIEDILIESVQLTACFIMLDLFLRKIQILIFINGIVIMKWLCSIVH